MTDRLLHPPLDKSRWGDGPWQTERDCLEWIDGTTNLRCMIVRAEWGHLCGYVGVPPGHPAFEQNVFTMSTRLVAHGGCNFNVMQDTECGQVWWFGFDCSHAFDLMPGWAASMEKVIDASEGMGNALRSAMRNMMNHDPRIYRDWDYVQHQVEQLALQLYMMKDSV